MIQNLVTERMRKAAAHLARVYGLTPEAALEALSLGICRGSLLHLDFVGLTVPRAALVEPIAVRYQLIMREAEKLVWQTS